MKAELVNMDTQEVLVIRDVTDIGQIDEWNREIFDKNPEAVSKWFPENVE